MAEFKIRKSQALPTTLEPNTIYLIKSATDTEVTVFISDNNATTPSAKGLTYLNKKGGNMTGSLGLVGVAANAFVNGTGDFNTFTDYNFGLSGWNSMAFINPTEGGAFKNQVSGLVDFRNGIINMKGGFQVNGQAVWHAGTFNPADYAVLRTAGNTGIGAVKYNGIVRNAGEFYGGLTSEIPSSNTRLNYDGYFYASRTYTAWVRGTSSDSGALFVNDEIELRGTTNKYFTAGNTGIKTQNPRDLNASPALAFPWKLGKASGIQSSPIDNDTLITVSVNGVLYSLLAKKITEEEEAY